MTVPYDPFDPFAHFPLDPNNAPTDKRSRAEFSKLGFTSWNDILAAGNLDPRGNRPDNFTTPQQALHKLSGMGAAAYVAKITYDPQTGYYGLWIPVDTDKKRRGKKGKSLRNPFSQKPKQRAQPPKVQPPAPPVKIRPPTPPTPVGTPPKTTGKVAPKVGTPPKTTGKKAGKIGTPIKKKKPSKR